MNNILVNPFKKLYAKLKDLLSTPKKRKYFAAKCINVFFNVVKYILRILYI